MKLNKQLAEELENQFPKGHPYRGEALVLHAIANIEIEKERKKCLEKAKEIIDDICNKEIIKAKNHTGYEEKNCPECKLTNRLVNKVKQKLKQKFEGK